MNSNSIIIYNAYNSKNNYYFQMLNKLLNDIRLIDELNIEIKNQIWNSNIKYRSSWNKTLTNWDSSVYLERGKWKDFIFSSNKFENKTSIYLTNFFNQLNMI